MLATGAINELTLRVDKLPTGAINELTFRVDILPTRAVNELTFRVDIVPAVAINELTFRVDILPTGAINVLTLRVELMLIVWSVLKTNWGGLPRFCAIVRPPAASIWNPCPSVVEPAIEPTKFPKLFLRFTAVVVKLLIDPVSKPESAEFRLVVSRFPLMDMVETNNVGGTTIAPGV